MRGESGRERRDGGRPAGRPAAVLLAGGKARRRWLAVLVGAAALIALPLSWAQGVTRAVAATASAGANPADCPGGVLTPHASIVISTDADWTAANGVTGGTGTPSDPYVISCWSIQWVGAPNSFTGPISIDSPTAGGGTTAKSYLIRDVQLTGPGASVPSYGISAATPGQTANMTVVGFAQGTSIYNRSMVTNSDFENNGIAIDAAAGLTGSVIKGSSTGIVSTFNVDSNNDVENNGVGVIATGGTVQGDTISHNLTGLAIPSGAVVVDSNVIDSNTNFGIDLTGSDGSSITNNTLEGNGQAAIDANADNIGTSSILPAAAANLIDGNHIGGSPFGIAFGYGPISGNLVTNTDWTDGHQSIVRFTNQNTVVDAGSSHLATTDQPVFFHDYIAQVNLGPGPMASTVSGGVNLSEATVDYAAVTGVHWDFGDGQSLDLPAAVATQGQGPEPDVTHQYGSTGNYTATLTVTATTSDGQTVTLSDRTPVTIATSPATSLMPASGGGSPWPMLGNSPDRPFYDGAEAAITKASVAQLVPKWRFPTNFSVTASPAVATVTIPPPVVGGTPTTHKLVFDGAFDGEFYAIDAATGLPAWRDCLVTSPVSTPASCDPQYPGNPSAPTDYGVITSSPEVASVTLPTGQARQEVLAAANATMNALDPVTGAVLWSFNGGATGYTGEATCPQVPGQGCEDLTYEIESSPVVVGNTVVFGIDCNGMCQKGGGIYALDASDGHMLWYFDPGAGQAYPGSASTFAYNPKMNGPASEDTCGGVWTSPSVDTALGLVYASTANCPTHPEPAYQEGAFALNLATGQPVWDYLPRALDSLDMDFGATPNIFQLGSEHVAGFASKDGTYTLLDAQTGAVKWSTKVALGGSFGGFYNATTDGSKVYLTSALSEASGFAGTPVEESFKGREYALDARTGNLVWRSYAGAPTLGQNSAVNGVYFTGGLDHLLHAWDASTGNLLTALPLAGAASSGPAVAGGEVFIGAGTGATFRSAVGPCTPSNLFGGEPPGECPAAPDPVGEYGQGIWGFCIATDAACAASLSASTISQHPTKVTYGGAASGDANDPATLSATLTDTTIATAPQPVTNRTLVFSLGDQTCTATTDANGRATCSVTLDEAAGKSAVTTQFLDDGTYRSSAVSTPFVVNHEETTLSYTGATALKKSAAGTLSATLAGDGTTPLQGRTVVFTLGTGTSAQQCSAATDASGTASCTLTKVRQSLGSASLTTSFGGDAYYRPASSTTGVRVQ